MTMKNVMNNGPKYDLRTNQCSLFKGSRGLLLVGKSSKKSYFEYGIEPILIAKD
jgi:hypothetical protein